MDVRASFTPQALEFFLKGLGLKGLEEDHLGDFSKATLLQPTRVVSITSQPTPFPNSVPTFTFLFLSFLTLSISWSLGAMTLSQNSSLYPKSASV